MKTMLLLMAMCGALVGCGEDEKVWIVLDLQMPNGEIAKMSFDNPAVPDMTLNECQESLPEATPYLMEHVQQNALVASAKLVSSHCVMSKEDPNKS